MGWLRAVLFIGGSAMFVYTAWRLATIREARLLRLSQMAFYAALMLIVLPKDRAAAGSDRPVWAAFVLLLVSFGLTIAHKTRPKPPVADAGSDADTRDASDQLHVGGSGTTRQPRE